MDRFRLEDVKLRDTVGADDRAFIEGLDMFFLATADADGRPSCSYKGGDPGFVTVMDDTTIAFPNYDGNGMFLSWGNALANPEVGLLFIDFERGHRMRLNGEASIDDGLRRLCEAVDAVAGESPDTVCNTVMDKLLDNQDNPDDDVALVVLRRTDVVDLAREE